ncbi:hypothetical protein Hanom_Chr16g01449071 [Helianthus anomalus]
MYGDAISRDMNSLLHSNTLKHPPHGEFAKIKQLISLDPYPNYDYQNQHESDENYGQTQSSFFSNLLRENGDNEFPKESFLTRQQHKEEKKYTVVKREREAGANQNLVRQKSTPAGFISSLTVENGKLFQLVILLVFYINLLTQSL